MLRRKHETSYLPGQETDLLLVLEHHRIPLFISQRHTCLWTRYKKKLCTPPQTQFCKFLTRLKMKASAAVLLIATVILVISFEDASATHHKKKKKWGFMQKYPQSQCCQPPPCNYCQQAPVYRPQPIYYKPKPVYRPPPVCNTCQQAYRPPPPPPRPVQ